MSASYLATEPQTLGTRRVAIALWLLALGVGSYFIAANVPGYLTLDEARYGPYFWPRAGYLLPHVLAGLIAIVLGPLQFWPRLRARRPRVHRITGRIYLSAILIGSLAGMTLAVTSGVGMAYAVGLFSLAVAWLSTSVLAFAAVRRRNFVQHREWMIRSYVVTFAFVVFRLGVDTLDYWGVADRATISTTMAWACWAVPLLVTELTLQGRKVFAASLRPRDQSP